MFRARRVKDCGQERGGERIIYDQRLFMYSNFSTPFATFFLVSAV